MKHAQPRSSGAKELSVVLDTLYSRELSAKRTGHLYGAFPYPTKISPEAIALFIAAHTKPGDTVFDGFAGSGTTGLATLLCEDPPDELRSEAERLKLNVTWGARNAVLYELGALGAFVGETLTNPPEPLLFRRAAEELLRDAEVKDGWIYGAVDPDGCEGTIRYVIWSDLLRCPACFQRVSLWDACVYFNPARISSLFSCPVCDHEGPLDNVERITENKWDDIIGGEQVQRVRRPARIYGATGKRRWSRPATQHDLFLLERVGTEPIPDSVPDIAIPWGDLYRRGYHKGITHLHQFYTRRNLFVFARLWERACRYGGTLGNAMRFWLLSYNASHATIMTRVVAKSKQKDLVVTSAQPGVLYISGLPVEKNLFAGLRRKLSTITSAFAIIHGRKSRVNVHQRSSCIVNLPDQSIDYVFTDPPFGGNIPYAEINFLNEAWLDRYTERNEEIIISRAQEKTVAEYQNLLKMALSEVHRILKPTGKATLVFHSASAEVWNALQSAYTDAGFGVECTSVLEKTQGSFKQVTTSGSVRGDPVLLLGKNSAKQISSMPDVWTVAEQLWQEAILSFDPGEQNVQRLYSRLVRHFLTHHQQIPLDAETFYQWYRERHSVEINHGAKY
ncbi:MAG: DNA methyltransferase [Gammaproteobacteria bacterium]|nr:DNA methyltransferase [Gammaproteobacteria bacterium]